MCPVHCRCACLVLPVHSLLSVKLCLMHCDRRAVRKCCRGLSIASACPRAPMNVVFFCAARVFLNTIHYRCLWSCSRRCEIASGVVWVVGDCARRRRPACYAERRASPCMWQSQALQTTRKRHLHSCACVWESVKAGFPVVSGASAASPVRSCDAVKARELMSV